MNVIRGGGGQIGSPSHEQREREFSVRHASAHLAIDWSRTQGPVSVPELMKAAEAFHAFLRGEPLVDAASGEA